MKMNLGSTLDLLKRIHVEEFLCRKIESGLAYFIVSRSFFVRFSRVSEQRLFLFHQFVRFFRQGNLDGNCCSRSAVFCLFGLCVARLISRRCGTSCMQAENQIDFSRYARVTISCQRNGANSVVSSLKLPLFQGSPVQTVGNWGNHFLGRDSRVINYIERQLTMKEKERKKDSFRDSRGRRGKEISSLSRQKPDGTCEIPQVPVVR